MKSDEETRSANDATKRPRKMVKKRAEGKRTEESVESTTKIAEDQSDGTKSETVKRRSADDLKMTGEVKSEALKAAAKERNLLREVAVTMTDEETRNAKEDEKRGVVSCLASWSRWMMSLEELKPRARRTRRKATSMRRKEMRRWTTEVFGLGTKMTNGVEIHDVIASRVNDQESHRVAMKVAIKNAEEVETEIVIKTVTDREIETVTEIAVVEIVIGTHLEMVSSKKLIEDLCLPVRGHLRAVARITTGHQQASAQLRINGMIAGLLQIEMIEAPEVLPQTAMIEALHLIVTIGVHVVLR